MTFFILSLLRMLNEASTFMDFVYSRKALGWWVFSPKSPTHFSYKQEQNLPTVLQMMNSAAATRERQRQNGMQSCLSRREKAPYKKLKECSQPSGQMDELLTNIHQPLSGVKITSKGRSTRVIPINSSPNPSILVEFFWRRDLLKVQRRKELTQKRGRRMGMPTKKMQVMVRNMQKWAAYLYTSRENEVICWFMCFCRILPSSSSRDDLSALHLLTQNRMLITRLSIMRTLVKRGETLRYQIGSYSAQREIFQTERRFLKSVEMMVRRDTQLLASKPKMEAQTRMGIVMVLRIRKEVQILVLVRRIDEKLIGRTQLTSLSTISPKSKLVIPAVMMTTYCTACQTYMSLRQSLQVYLTSESVKDSTK